MESHSHQLYELWTGLVTAGKLATLNWAELLKTLAPIALTTILASFGVVAWYGSVQTEKLSAVFETKLEKLRIEAERYCDVKRAGRFTQSDFDREMKLRDTELVSIAQKQDEVRERLIAGLRADHERLSAEFKAFMSMHGRERVEPYK